MPIPYVTMKAIVGEAHSIPILTPAPYTPEGNEQQCNTDQDTRKKDIRTIENELDV